jgi:hypothetical protein
MNANTQPDADPAFDPAEALRVLEEQDAKVGAQFGNPDRKMYLAWGVAYLLGYLPLALSRGADPIVDIPIGVALGIFSVCIGLGIVAAVILGVRATRGMRGESSRRGMLYGFSWWFSFMCIAGLSIQLGKADIDPEITGIIINGASMALVAALLMAGGVIWLDASQFVIGAAIALITLVALVVGLPAYWWIMCLGAGGLLLLAALFHKPLRRILPGSLERQGVSR